MKIIELIELIDLDKDIPFIPLDAGKHPANELTIYSNADGICFWKDAEISSLSISENCKDKVYKIKRLLINHFNELDNNERELNKYLAVTELLIAIDLYREGKGTIDINEIKSYVNRLNSKMIESLDFKEIPNMKYLIDRVKKDKLYRECYFNIFEVMSNKYDFLLEIDIVNV